MNYLRKLIDDNDPASVKRFTSLVVLLHFILASFATLFFTYYVVLVMPKGAVDKDLLGAFKQILEYDFYIIISGLGFITSTDLVQLWVSKYKQPTSMGYEEETID